LTARLEERFHRRSFGLQEDWSRIEEILTKVIPVYEKVNRYISLGTDLSVRREGISLLLDSLSSQIKGEHLSVLDLGSGPGEMSELFLSDSASRGMVLVQYDALLEMMRVSKRRNPSTDQILGVYENIPIRNGVFDGAMAGFAIRDARDLVHALSQIAGSLKQGGYFLIVDLSKPDSKIKKFLVGVYLRTLSPFLATIASPKLGRKFGALYTTYLRLPARSEFLGLLYGAGFEVVFEKYRMLGGSAVILLKNSKNPKN
jgi:demethylmenaquinone methyltransferase / 2-methoxy-6-polyprenyl-1,4-benzoquinol methylase